MSYVLASGLVLFSGYLVWRWPVWGLALLVASVPLDLPLKVGITVYTNELLLVGSLAGFGFRYLLQKEKANLEWRELLAGVPFLAIIVLSVFNSGSWSDMIKALLRALEFLAAIWLAVNLLKRIEDAHRILKIFLLVATVFALLGTAQSLFGIQWGVLRSPYVDIFANRPWMRATATFGHPNQFAGYLLLSLPLAWLFFLRAQNWQERTRGLLLFLPLFSGLVFSFSRAAWGAFAAVALVLIFARSKIRFLILSLAGLELGLMLLAQTSGPFLEERQALTYRIFSLRHVEKIEAWNSRLRMYRAGLDMWQTHPWLGLGAGTYGRHIGHYFPQPSPDQDAARKHIHDLYLQILIETGILGLITFLGMIAYYLSLLWRARPTGFDGLLIGGVMAGTFAFLLHNTLDVLMVYGRGTDFGYWLGLGLALFRLQRPLPVSGCENQSYSGI